MHQCHIPQWGSLGTVTISQILAHRLDLRQTKIANCAIKSILGPRLHADDKLSFMTVIVIKSISSDVPLTRPCSSINKFELFKSRWMKMGLEQCSQFMPSAASLAIFMRVYRLSLIFWSRNIFSTSPRGKNSETIKKFPGMVHAPMNKQMFGWKIVLMEKYVSKPWI